MIRHADESIARRAVVDWGGDPTSLSLLGVSGSAVWRFRAVEGMHRDLVLRLVDPAHRTREQVESELTFMAQLWAFRANVAMPIPAEGTEWTRLADGFVASVMTFAEGDEHPRAEGTPAFDRAWGSGLGEIAHLSRWYEGPAPWEWHEEPWLADAERLLPSEDGESRAIWAALRTRLAKFPRGHLVYGMIHGDHGPQNFRYVPNFATVTTFDFGNACLHWYAMDVTIALSTLRRDPARARRSADLIAGYESVDGPVPLLHETWSDLLRLRWLYVYLSRLDAFGPAPDAAQQATLASMRELVVHGEPWPLPEEFL